VLFSEKGASRHDVSIGNAVESCLAA